MQSFPQLPFAAICNPHHPHALATHLAEPGMVETYDRRQPTLSTFGCDLLCQRPEWVASLDLLQPCYPCPELPTNSDSLFLFTIDTNCPEDRPSLDDSGP